MGLPAYFASLQAHNENLSTVFTQIVRGVDHALVGDLCNTPHCSKNNAMDAQTLLNYAFCGHKIARHMIFEHARRDDMNVIARSLYLVKVGNLQQKAPAAHVQPGLPRAVDHREGGITA
jgi:hypothetical protein